MALIRCPGCRNDTSDSLAHCPNCGAPLRGSGPGLFDRGAATQSPMPIARSEPGSFASATHTAPPTPGVLDPASRAARGSGWSTQAKAIGFVVVLVVLAVVPHSLPILAVLAVLWMMANRTRAGSGSGPTQVEALRILVDEVRRPRSQTSTERPLERMRRLEEQLKRRNA